VELPRLPPQKGIDVILLDVNGNAVKTGIDAVEGRLRRAVASGKMSPAKKTLPRLDVLLSVMQILYDEFADSNIVRVRC
jgi:3-hydroxyacyl-CoA dehydrogenase